MEMDKLTERSGYLGSEGLQELDQCCIGCVGCFKLRPVANAFEHGEAAKSGEVDAHCVLIGFGYEVEAIEGAGEEHGWLTDCGACKGV